MNALETQSDIEKFDQLDQDFNKINMKNLKNQLHNSRFVVEPVEEDSIPNVEKGDNEAISENLDEQTVKIDSKDLKNNANKVQVQEQDEPTDWMKYLFFGILIFLFIAPPLALVYAREGNYRSQIENLEFEISYRDKVIQQQAEIIGELNQEIYSDFVQDVGIRNEFINGTNMQENTLVIQFTIETLKGFAGYAAMIIGCIMVLCTIFTFSHVYIEVFTNDGPNQKLKDYKLMKTELALAKEVNELQSDEMEKLDCLVDKYHDALDEILEKHNVYPDQDSMLHVSVLKKLPKMTDLLAFNGTNLDGKDKSGFTALQYAALYGDSTMAKILIEHGAQINFENDESPLHCASYRGHTKIAKMLIENGAEVNGKDKNQNTALHNAAEFGHIEFAKILIENGADEEALNCLNKTPLDILNQKLLYCK